MMVGIYVIAVSMVTNRCSAAPSIKPELPVEDEKLFATLDNADAENSEKCKCDH